MKSVQQMKYSCIVFDTAPTGHTLRLIRFPTTLQTAIDKMMVLKVRAFRSLWIVMHMILFDSGVESVWRVDQFDDKHDGRKRRDAGGFVEEV